MNEQMKSMNIYNKKVGIVVRSVGERTEGLVMYAIKRNGFSDDDIRVVRNITPFVEALRTGYEEALTLGREYTFFIDADVVVMPDTLSFMVGAIDYFPRNMFFMNPLTYEYTTGMIIPSGPHLYRTEFLKEALAHIPLPKESKRPETYVTKRMYEKGYENIYLDIPVALHEFEQYYDDYSTRIIQKYLKATSERRKNIQAYVQKMDSMGNEDFRVMNETLVSLLREDLPNLTLKKGEFDALYKDIVYTEKEPITDPALVYRNLLSYTENNKNDFLYGGYTKRLLDMETMKQQGFMRKILKMMIGKRG